MTVDKKSLVIRAGIFLVFVFCIFVFPEIVPLTYPGSSYYITYIQDGWSFFYMLFLYPVVFFCSGIFCTLFRCKPFALCIIPDILIGLPEFIDRSNTSSGFFIGTFLLNLAVHLLLWLLGGCTVLGVRALIALIRSDISSYRAKKAAISDTPVDHGHFSH
ncbi:MAG: hypothetical protein E7604_02360 [Ruminococcaceae bacterium]|nr:hypothetical protein [Oscillospiraceae bacterium]